MAYPVAYCAALSARISKFYASERKRGLGIRQE
jgi:hypothetical protein